MLALIVTVAAYAIALRLRRIPAVLTSALAVAAVVPLLHIDTRAYTFGTAPFVALLGPAVVALAVPLVRARDALRATLAPALAGIAAGSVVAIVTAIGIGRALHLRPELIAAIAPRAATSPVAASIAQTLHADPHIAAAASVAGGVLCAVLSPVVFRLARSRFGAGLALGTAGHGIGTAYANAVDENAGAAAAAAMALNALATAILAPVLVTALLG